MRSSGRRGGLRIAAALLLLAGCAPPPSSGGGPEPASGGGDLAIVATLDLTSVSDDQDRVPVAIDPGPLSEDTVLFRLPRVVQGTYAVSDFGRMVDDLRALDGDGVEMPVEEVDVNTWRVVDATRLDRIVYRVNDTYDQERDPGDMPFSPSGTNIHPDAFVLNLHGFVGYFEGQGEADYEIRITAPSDLVASSALPLVDSVAAGPSVTRVYRADRYFEVTDNPLFYGHITVASFDVPDMRIVLSVYSPGGKYDAATLAPALERGMRAQRAYLGDLVSTDRYDVFLFLAGDGDDQPAGAGALEHHRSTVVNLLESVEPDALQRALIDVVSHEFFHTVSPLAVHSEDVHYFDYHDPTFSKHLWMYEGQTEYFAQHFQVHEGLLSREEFLRRLTDKMLTAAQYDDTVSFTVMSENVLSEPYASAYRNVYQKGALIGMCLDVLLRSESRGARSLLGLMQELSERYGVDRPFEDDAIIEEIGAMTYPEVEAFLRTHVAGTTPIDYDACLDPAGVEVAREPTPADNLFFPTWPARSFRVDPTSEELYVTQVVSTFADMGVRLGDRLVSINGVEVTLETLSALMDSSRAWTADQELEVIVNRDGRPLELRGVLGEPTWLRPEVRLDPDPTPAQAAIRESWLGGD